MLIFDTLEKSIKDYFFIVPYRLSIKMILKNLYKSIIIFNKALIKFFDKVKFTLLGPKIRSYISVFGNANLTLTEIKNLHKKYKSLYLHKYIQIRI
jgi:hypothetical protein